MSDEQAAKTPKDTVETGPDALAEGEVKTAAELLGMKQMNELKTTPGLSHSPGLREVPNSFAPATATGEPVPHVFGPGQNPADPIAAGLDVSAVLQTRAENRAITQTGADAAGPRPHTYIEKTGPDQVPQAAPADGRLVAAPADAAADASPGPNSVAAAGSEPAKG